MTQLLEFETYNKVSQERGQRVTINPQHITRMLPDYAVGYTQIVLADGASSTVIGSYEVCVQMWGAAL